MTLNDLGNLGEFVSGVAVVVSIIYLAAQVRQNTRSLQTSAARAAVDTIHRLNQVLIQNKEAAELFVAGTREPDAFQGFDEADKLRFDSLAQSLLLLYQDLFFAASASLVSPDLWEPQERRMMDYLTRPGFRLWWDQNSWRFSRSFSTFIEVKRGELGGEKAGKKDGKKAGRKAGRRVK